MPKKKVQPLKTYKVSISPSKEIIDIFKWISENCRCLYNHFLEIRIGRNKNKEKQPTWQEQVKLVRQLKEKEPKLAKIFSQVLQDVPRRRVAETWQNYKQYKKINPRANYPREKTPNRWYDTFTYPQFGFKLENNQLILSQGRGEKELRININLHRPIKGKIKTLTITWKNGKYYACFSCEAKQKPRMPISQVKRKVGIDRGVINLLATSEGWKYANPRFFKKGADKLTKLYQAMSRKQHKRFKDDNTENSKWFERVRLKLAHEFKKISNRMKDRNHKLSRKLVNVFDLIAYEDLKLKKMSKKKPNQKRKINKYTVKSLQQASLRMLGDFTTYKVQETGKWIVFVDPKDTSQTCSKCHQKSLIKQELNDRIFICANCENVLDRDINSAKNILYKAQTELGTLSSGRV